MFKMKRGSTENVTLVDHEKKKITFLQKVFVMMSYYTQNARLLQTKVCMLLV